MVGYLLSIRNPVVVCRQMRYRGRARLVAPADRRCAPRALKACGARPDPGHRDQRSDTKRDRHAERNGRSVDQFSDPRTACHIGVWCRNMGIELQSVTL